MRAFLSIDWDYFVRSLYSWDWGHQESPFFMEGGMWEIRVSGLLMQGLDIRGEMDPKKWAQPKPWSFWNILSQLGYDFSMLDESSEVGGICNYMVADSHAVAGPFFREVSDFFGHPDIIINFDAHHDMGYGDKAKIDRLVKSGQVTCDMWLRLLMSRYPKMRANVVYPNWRFEEFSLESEKKELKRVLPPGVFKRTQIGAFMDETGAVSDVVKPANEIKVQALFICRSSAWAPPWLDKQFIDFVSEFGNHTGIEPCEYVHESLQNIKPFTPRDSFSWERAEAMAKQWKDMMGKKVPSET